MMQYKTTVWCAGRSVATATDGRQLKTLKLPSLKTTRSLFVTNNSLLFCRVETADRRQHQPKAESNVRYKHFVHETGEQHIIG